MAFSEDIGISFRALREDAFTVTGGRVTGGSRVDGLRDLFKMTVRPDSDGDVTITGSTPSTVWATRTEGMTSATCSPGPPAAAGAKHPGRLPARDRPPRPPRCLRRGRREGPAAGESARAAPAATAGRFRMSPPTRAP